MCFSIVTQKYNSSSFYQIVKQMLKAFRQNLNKITRLRNRQIFILFDN